MDLRYSIDSAEARDGHLMGWGWCLPASGNTCCVDLALTFADGASQSVACLTARARDDVAQAYADDPRAATAGFIFLAVLAGRDIVGARLVVTRDDGVVDARELAGFPIRFAPGSLDAGVVASRARIAWRLLRAGRLALLKRKLSGAARHALSRFLPSATPRPPARAAELFFDHQLGGGANRYREERVDAVVAAGGTAAAVTFELPRLLYRYVIRDGDGAREEFLPSFGALRDRLSALPLSAVHVNNLVSFPDPRATGRLAVALAAAAAAPLSVYLHDHHMACPSYTLLDAGGRFCNLPDEATCRACLARNTHTFPAFAHVPEIAPWRADWRAVLEAATRIVAFSDATRRLYARAFPGGEWHARLVVEPHAIDRSRYPRLTPRLEAPLAVAVVGHIHFAKGAAIVHELVALIDARRLPLRVVVVGSLERANPSPSLTVTGPFDNAELPALIARHGIGICLLPSICPETFSYVTEEMTTMGIPMVCFDLGAPADRLRAYDLGEIATETSAEGALAAIQRLAARLTTLQGKTSA